MEKLQAHISCLRDFARCVYTTCCQKVKRRLCLRRVFASAIYFDFPFSSHNFHLLWSDSFSIKQPLMQSEISRTCKKMFLCDCAQNHFHRYRTLCKGVWVYSLEYVLLLLYSGVLLVTQIYLLKMYICLNFGFWYFLLGFVRQSPFDRSPNKVYCALVCVGRKRTSLNASRAS